ncbi:MAG: AraC family transcriptional regulator [Bacteroidaceae bacterium]|nr:AraC family transcriptional regulator [Bacteroidaceae bacterium]
MDNLNIRNVVEKQVTTIYNEKIALINNLGDLENVAKQQVLVEAFVFVMIVRGQAQAQIEGKTIKFREGDIFASTPRQVLEASMFSIDFEMKTILITPEYAEQIANMVKLDWSISIMFAHRDVIHAGIEGMHSLLIMYDLLQYKLQTPDTPNKQNELDSLLCFIAYEMFDLHIAATGSDLPQQTFSSAENLFQRFIKLLNKQNHKYMSVNEYAEELNVTPKYFSSVCKRVSGKTASEIIDEEVIKSAKIMMRDNSVSIKQIADTLNFTNQSHFGTFFRRHVGMSPQQFRQRNL